MSHVFISYSHTDQVYAHALGQALEQAGFDIWIDNRIDYGTSWPSVIQENIDKCAALILVMTPRAYSSIWVQNELSYAISKQKKVFPLLVEGNIWLSVASIQVINLIGPRLPPPKFYEILGQFAHRHSLPKFELPLFSWCNIPAGEVQVDDKVHSIEAFSISRYPITNSQFEQFVNDPEGYSNTRWWQYSLHSTTWHRKKPLPAEARFPAFNRARDSVNWYEAIAFCLWLGNKATLPITLPTTLQWRRAAQRETPTKVSIFGVCGMDEISEWCLTEYGSERETTDSKTPHVVLRGTWSPLDKDAPTIQSSWSYSTDQTVRIGFRVVCPIPVE